MMRRTLQFLVNFGAIAMPALSPSMDNGTIVEWKKKVGDLVKEGDLFCTVQTDKAVVDYTNSFDEGYLAKIFVPNGEACEVGKTIAVMVDEKADLAKADQYVPEGETRDEETSSSPAPASDTPSVPSAAGNREPPEGVSIENIAMPALSPSMDNGTIVEWKKKVGDLVKEGDLFCTVQTDKAVVDYTNSFDEGYLAKIFVQNGEACEVGKTIAAMVTSAEDISKVGEYHPADAPGSASSSSPAPPTPSSTPAVNKEGSKKRFGGSLEEAIKASGPSVIRIAAGLDEKTLQTIPSSGKGGRFLKSDFVGQPGFDYNDASPTVAKGKPSPAKPTGGAAKTASVVSQEGIYDVELKAGPVIKSMNDSNLLRRFLRTMPIPPKKLVKAQ